MITTETRSYEADGVVCEAYIARPADLSTPRPCVLIAHMWGGPNPFIHDKARLLAQQGYVAFAMDMYGIGKRGTTPEQSAALMRPFIE
ncbi:carboxymethylenebutenolidase, partial [Halomonas sp. ND22Bw]|uniref:dienelactone hydrolase family protein n=1 Tax=Halomonas sp. ND22Bw TaxID=2054178 RepID=UPI000D286356